VLYDLANTIFALGVMGLYFPEWLVVSQGRSDFSLSITIFGAMAVVIILGPWIGARSDYAGRRVPYLTATTTLAVVATFFLTSVSVAPTLILLMLALIGVNLGVVVYDALLLDVSTTTNRGLVSGLGVGIGYLGSAVALLAGVLIVGRFGYSAYFRTVALLFLLFALPAFLFIKERPRPRTSNPPGLFSSIGHLVGAWRRAATYRGVARFLVGRFFYTDAINTLISGFMTIFVLEELGFTLEELEKLLAAAIAASVVGGLFGGRLVDRLGPRRVLHAALYVWMGAIVVGIAAAQLDLRVLGWVLGPLGGLALGATWAADRVYMARISPPRYFGEFYGLYATVGRFATWFGPLLWGLIADVAGLGRSAAMLSLAVLLIIGRIILRGVDDRPRVWTEADFHQAV
jgi:UMF1 family MFS transporter